jgi:hypothetical protein
MGEPRYEALEIDGMRGCRGENRCRRSWAFLSGRISYAFVCRRSEMAAKIAKLPTFCQPSERVALAG